MPQRLRDGLHRNTCLQCQNRAGVSEIVESGLRHTNLLYNPLEMLQDTDMLQMPTEFVCKDKIMLVAPSISSCQPPLCLLRLLVLKHLDNAGCHGNCPAFAILRFIEENVPTGSLFLKLAADMKFAFLKVYVFPLKPQNLGLTQSGKEIYDINGLIGVSLNRLQKLVNLFVHKRL